MSKEFNIFEFLKTRPLSWSAISSFEYDPEQWYQRYVLGIKDEASAQMTFGKIVGEKLASDPKFFPEIPRLSIFEQPLEIKLGDIPMIGYMDAHTPKYHMDEYKTGVKPWDQKRADEHGQIDMYLLMHYLINKVPPEKMNVRIFWMPTKMNGDYTISFVRDGHVLCFPTKRTMRQLLDFGSRIKRVVKEMQNYARLHA